MKRHVKYMFRGLVVTAVLALVTAGGMSTAHADSATENAAAVSQQIATAVTDTDGAPAASNPDVTVNTSTGSASFDTGSGTLMLTTPSDGDGTTIGKTTVLDGDGADNSLAIQPTDQGVRAAIEIDSSDAPEVYPFQVGGDATSLHLNNDGSVTAYNGDDTLAYISAPWAIDARGAAVATHYEVDGTRLYQVVNHHVAGVTYPVIADPSLKLCDTLTHYCITFTSAQTKKIWYAASGTPKDIAAVACGLISGVGAVACGAVVVLVASALAKSAKSYVRQGKCLQIHVPPTFPIAGTPSWKGVSC